jgi:endonuclease YncB( thermonuclease family)
VGALVSGSTVATALPVRTQACSADGGTTAIVTSVDDRSELILADGRVVKLAGIDIPAPAPTPTALSQAARKALSDWLAGHEVTLRPVLATPDRWNRMVAHVFARPDYASPDPDPPASAAAVLVDAGLARVHPSVDVRDCTAELIAAEADARRDGLGLWRDPYYGVLAATDSGRLADRAGTFVLVEGQVMHVGHGRSRTFIDFGRDRDSFTVTIPSRGSGKFEAAGLSPGSLAGARIRVRGILDTRFGPRIEAAEPIVIERLPLEPAP